MYVQHSHRQNLLSLRSPSTLAFVRTTICSGSGKRLERPLRIVHRASYDESNKYNTKEFIEIARRVYCVAKRVWIELRRRRMFSVSCSLASRHSSGASSLYFCSSSHRSRERQSRRPVPENNICASKYVLVCVRKLKRSVFRDLYKSHIELEAFEWWICRI